MSPVPRSKVMPRFERPGRGRGADEVVRPVPPLLLKLAAEREEVARHENLAARYVEARTRLVALGSKLEGGPSSRSRRGAGRCRDGSEEEGREGSQGRARDRGGPARGRSARGVDRGVGGRAPESRCALPRCSRRGGVREGGGGTTEARDAIVAAQHRFEEAATLAGEADWIVMLRRTGTTYPWTGGKGAEADPGAAALVREAITAYDYDREQRTRNLAKRDEEEAVEAKLPRAPAASVSARRRNIHRRRGRRAQAGRGRGGRPGVSPSPTPTVDRFQLGLTPPLSMASFRLRSVGRSCAPLALCVAGPLRPARWRWRREVGRAP